MTIDEAAVRYESDGKKRSFVFRLSEIEKVKQLSVWSGRVVEIRLKNGEKYTITSNDSKWSNDAILRAINRAMGRQ